MNDECIDQDTYECADSAVSEWAMNDFVTLYNRKPTDSDEDQGMMDEIKEYYYDKYCGRYI